MLISNQRILGNLIFLMTIIGVSNLQADEQLIQASINDPERFEADVKRDGR